MNTSLVATVLQLVLDAGADAARVVCADSLHNTFSVFNDRLDKIHCAGDSSVTVCIFTGGRYGSFCTNKLDTDSLNHFVRNAVSLVRLLERDPFRNLPPVEMYFDGSGDNLEVCDPAYESIDADTKKRIAFSVADEVITVAGDRFRGAEVDVEDDRCTMIIADTNGFCGEETGTSFSVAANCSLLDDDGSVPESFWYEKSIFFDELNFTGCGRKAAERGLDSLGPKKLKAGRYGIILDNSVSSKFIMSLVNALDGAAIDQNNSFLKGCLGMRVLPEILTITDVPHRPRSFGSTYFDAEGIATRRTTLIGQGVIERYFADTYYSKKLGLPLTGGDYSALEVLPSARNLGLEAMMSEMDRGVLVTGFNGGNYNHVTGDFSYGIRGFFFEKGILKHPVRGMNITGNILEFYKGLLSVGDDARKISAVRVPTLSFESGNLS